MSDRPDSISRRLSFRFPTYNSFGMCLLLLFRNQVPVLGILNRGDELAISAVLTMLTPVCPCAGTQLTLTRRSTAQQPNHAVMHLLRGKTAEHILTIDDGKESAYKKPPRSTHNPPCPVRLSTRTDTITLPTVARWVVQWRLYCEKETGCFSRKG